MMRVVFGLAILACSIAFASAQSLTPQTDPEALADLRVARGDKDIAQAWFVSPTTRYQHYVLGSKYEAGGLRVKMRNGAVITLKLDANHAFEDRQPRLADLDGDGRDEVIVVQSKLDKGGSLAAYGVVGDQLKLKAQTPYIGQPYRWLNPAGIADLDGDGRLDVAFVAMPHLIKRLELWTLQDGSFKRWGAFVGYSNHRNGSVHTAMSVVSDFNNDGVLDLALPGADRRSIELISLKSRQLKTLNSTSLPASADGTMSLNSGVISVPLENGERFGVSTQLK